MATYSKYQVFVADICNKVHNLSSDTCKVSLSNTASVASDTYATMIAAEISAGNGYSAGGTAAASPSSTQTTGTYTFSANNVTFTASGGTIGPFQYVRLYNSTASKNIAYFNYGSAVTLNSGDTFSVAWNGGGSSGTIFTLV